MLSPALYVQCWHAEGWRRQCRELEQRLFGIALRHAGAPNLLPSNLPGPCTLPPADGPYLLRLRHLSLRGNALHALPPALAGATQLEALDCGENQG